MMKLSKRDNMFLANGWLMTSFIMGHNYYALAIACLFLVSWVFADA